MPYLKSNRSISTNPLFAGSLLLFTILIFSPVFAIEPVVLIDPEPVLAEATALVDVSFDSLNDRVDVDVSLGGFENPEVFLDGLKLHQGKGRLVYLAPDVESTVTLTFSWSDQSWQRVFRVASVESLNLPQSYFVIAKLAGQAAVKRAGEKSWLPAFQGMVLKAGDGLATLDDSSVILASQSGHEVVILPRSLVFLRKVREDGDLADITLEVQLGELVVKTKGSLRSGSKFTVKGGSVTAGVRGTIFAFENRDETIVRAFEGAVYLYWKGKAALIQAGQMWYFRARFDRLMVERKLAMEGYYRSPERAQKFMEHFGGLMLSLDRDFESYKELVDDLFHETLESIESNIEGFLRDFNKQMEELKEFNPLKLP